MGTSMYTYSSTMVRINIWDVNEFVNCPEGPEAVACASRLAMSKQLALHVLSEKKLGLRVCPEFYRFSI